MKEALSVEGYQFPYMVDRALRMLRDLYARGFAAFG